MYRFSILFGVAVAIGCALGTWLSRGVVETPAAATEGVVNPLAQLRFERNEGQIDTDAPWFARGRGYHLYIDPTGATLALRTPTGHQRVRMEVLGASPQAQVEGERELPARVNYLVGAPSRWRSGLPLFAQARVGAIYPGIDLVYYGRDGRLEYDFVVAPGADPRQIRLRFDGARTARLDDDGALRLAVGRQELVQHPPVVYQEGGGERTTVAGRYVIDAQGTVGFELAAYDAARPLVIDPIMTYATLLGGSGEDIALDIAVDDGNHVYVVGQTTSADLPATEGAYDTTYGGEPWLDAFVAKLHPGDSQLEYLTYLGGSGYETASAVAVDSLGQAYVAGNADFGAFLVTPGAVGSDNGDCTGGFIIKLSSDGGTPLYAACLDHTAANDVVLAADGSVYVGGTQTSGDYTTAQAAVAHVSADGSSLLYLTTFGGSKADSIAALAADAVGNVYVTGATASDTDFPATPGAYDDTHGGRTDGFVAKLDASGELVYATLLGGSDPDYSRSIAVDDDGNAYVGGWTGDGSGPSTGDFPVTPGAFRTEFEGQNDGFVAKLDASGSTLLWSTLVNSDSAPTDNVLEEVYDLALAPRGFVYAVGIIGGFSAFPVTSGALDETPNGGDAYLLVLTEDGSRAVYATYVGGSGIEDPYAVEIDSGGWAWLAGGTTPGSTPFPTTANAYDQTHNNPLSEQYVADAFVLKLRPIVNSAATFKAASADVPAEATEASIDVRRDGDTAGEFLVDYTVKSGADVLAQGTLTWADGESADQSIVTDLPASPDADVVLTLALPNGRLGTCKTAIVSRDGGSGTGAPCPVETSGDTGGDGGGDNDAGAGGAFSAWLLLLAVIRFRRAGAFLLMRGGRARS
jgi:hypothetical protein